MAWPDEVQYAKDSNGNVVGVTTLGSLVKSPYEKMNALKAKPVGFNYFSILYDILTSVGTADMAGQLAYVTASGANIIRVAAFFTSAEYLTLVHNTAQMPSTVSDSNLRASFVSALDTVFNTCATYGIKIHYCDFFGSTSIPAAFASPETVLVAYDTTTSQTVTYMKSAAAWFVNRYSNHAAWGLYSIGNEYKFDESNTLRVTSKKLGNVFTEVANSARAVNPNIMVTADLLTCYLATQWGSTRAQFDGNVEGTAREMPFNLTTAYDNLCSGLDVLCFHVYEEAIYAGRGNADNNNAAFLVTAANTKIGFEGVESLAANLKAYADSRNKPLIFGEVGVSSTQESDSANIKKHRLIRGLNNYCSYQLLWNVQDSTSGTSGYGGGQATWFIAPSTTRANTYKALALQYNKSKALGSVSPIALQGVRKIYSPKAWVKCADSATGYITCTSSAGLAALTSPTIMTWIRIDGNIAANEIIADFRTSTSFGGFYLAGGATPNTTIQLVVRNATTDDLTSDSILPLLNVGEAYHLAISYETVNGVKCATFWLNGLYWRSVIGAGTNAGIADGSVLRLGGTITNGAAVSYQDFAVMNQSSYQDIQNHIRGSILPQSLIHIRAFNTGTFENMVKSPVNSFVNSGAATVDSE